MQEEIDESRAEKIQEEIGSKIEENKDEALEILFAKVRTKYKEENLSHASEQLVEYLEDVYHFKALYGDEDTTKLWVYRDGIWTPHGHIIVKEYVRKCFDPEFKPHMYNRIIDKIKADNHCERTKFLQREDKNGVCLENGIYDYDKEKVVEHTPDRVHFSKIPWEYKEDADCPHIKEHFRKVLKNEDEDIKVIQEMIGHCLLKEYNPEKIFMLIGDGSNGKSITIQIIKELLGQDQASSLGIHELINEVFAKSELFGQFANLGADISGRSLENTSVLKNLTGDMITADRKHKSRISFENYATMIFACNNLPRTYDTTDAFFRRWIVLQFPYKFKDEGDITDEDGNFVRVKDPNILDDLTTDDELRGLLRWGLEGARRLRREGDFSYSKTTEDVRKYWFSKSDTFQAFASECLEKKPGFRINKEDLIKAYHLYCDEKNLSLVDDKNIKRIMRKEFGSTRTRTTQGGKKVYRFDNVKFRFDDQEFAGNRKYSDSDGLIRRLQHPDFSRNMSVDDVVLDDDCGDLEDEDDVVKDDGDDGVVDGVSEDMSYGVKKKNLENYLSRNGGKASIESLIEFGFGQDFIDKLLREGDLMENPSGYVQML